MDCVAADRLLRPVALSPSSLVRWPHGGVWAKGVLGLSALFLPAACDSTLSQNETFSKQTLGNTKAADRGSGTGHSGPTGFSPRTRWSPQERGEAGRAPTFPVSLPVQGVSGLVSIEDPVPEHAFCFSSLPLHESSFLWAISGYMNNARSL